MKALRKDTVREIRKSLSRFLSIVAIIALGICFFGGVKSTSPSMKYTANQYFEAQKLADIHLVSTYGFTDDDVAALKKVEGVAAVMPTYSTDVIVENGEKRPVFKVLAVSAEDGLNQPLLLEGRMPEKDNECVIEMPDTTGPHTGRNAYSIGSTIKMSPEVGDKKLEDTLSQREYTVVGYIRSPQYISIERGSTSVGSGDISFYMMVKPEVFKSERYTDAYVYSTASADGVSAYSTEYKDAVSELEKRLETVGHDRLQVNYDDIMTTGTQEIDKAKRELLDAQTTFDDEIAKAEQQLRDAEQQIVDGEAELAEGQRSYDEMVASTTKTLNEKQDELQNAESQWNTGQQQYADGQSQYEQNKAAFDAGKPDAEKQIAEKKAELDQLGGMIDSIKSQIAVIEAIPEEKRTEEQKQALIQLKAQLQNLQPVYDQGIEALNAAIQQLRDAENQLAAAKAQLDQSKAELDSAAVQIEQGKTAITQGWQQLEQGKAQAEQQLAEGRQKLDDARRQLAEGRTELETKRAEGQQKLDDARQKIADSEKELKDVDFGKWYVFNRDDNPGYSGYGEDANRIDNVAGIFPVFFLLVAALVAFTTMTRMVEEQRMEIGTLKALGYSPASIASKFVIYAALAAVVGCAIGVVSGINTLPRLIVGAYSLLYQVPELSLSVPWGAIIISCIITLLCTVGAAILICSVELREEPSELMRPKAPKIGKRIFLEKIPFIWKRMGFISKVTARNILRYKARFFMTVIGISGCTALILAGFGLQDSIFSIIPKQFEEISVYDGMMAFKNEDTLDAKAPLESELRNDAQVEDAMLAKQLKMSVALADGDHSKDAYLYVPETPGDMNRFIDLRHRKETDQKLTLDDSGAIITEKLANDLGIKVGDTIRLYSDDKEFKIKVADITENYIENYVYVSPKAYEAASGEPVKYNIAYFNLKDTGTDAENAFGEKWLDNSDVVSVSFTGSIVKSSTDSLSSLNMVVLVMLVAAGALAFVVLYNLTNINVSERVREIATIRVLGFYDRETNNYIFRENIILSFIGMLIGLGLGVILNNFIITTVETDIVMFGRGIDPSSYVFACIFTMAFTLIVNIFMAPVIKKVDMVESLKSIE